MEGAMCGIIKFLLQVCLKGQFGSYTELPFCFPLEKCSTGHPLRYNISEIAHDFGLEKMFASATI
jgi:hypothetical protein